MFRLHTGGRRPSHEPGTWRGKKSLTFEVNTALRFHSTHQATVPAIGGRMFFKSLTYLGPEPQAGRSQPRSSQSSASVLTSSCLMRSQTPRVHPLLIHKPFEVNEISAEGEIALGRVEGFRLRVVN